MTFSRPEKLWTCHLGWWRTFFHQIGLPNSAFTLTGLSFFFLAILKTLGRIFIILAILDAVKEVKVVNVTILQRFQALQLMSTEIERTVKMHKQIIRQQKSRFNRRTPILEIRRSGGTLIVIEAEVAVAIRSHANKHRVSLPRLHTNTPTLSNSIRKHQFWKLKTLQYNTMLFVIVCG